MVCGEDVGFCGDVASSERVEDSLGCRLSSRVTEK